MKSKSNLIVFWILVLTALCCSCVPETSPERDLAHFFEDQSIEGSFLLYDSANEEYIRFCADRCEKQFIPASTFKLLNAQIALETGVIEDENEIIAWDGIDRGIPSWNQDHDLRTAMQNSVVWFYEELARRIGLERMQHYVDLVEYGNQDISGESVAFWLEGNLRISQVEQIDFLQKLYREELPFSEDTMRTVKEIIVLEETDYYRLSGKTGWAISVDPDIGWFVGYLERDVTFISLQQM